MEGESKDRQRAKKLEIELTTQNLPFTFTVKGSGGGRLSEIRLAPCVAVCNLVDVVTGRLDTLDR